MAIVLEANYSKKLGLPGYSSHQYSVTIKTEVADPNQVAAENTRLYGLLQSCVDTQIQKTGYLPTTPAGNRTNGNGNGNAHANSNGHRNGGGEAWTCSDKQKALILDIVGRNGLDKDQVEELAQDRFGKAVKGLNKLEASGLIDALIAQTGGPSGNGQRNYRGNPQKAGNR